MSKKTKVPTSKRPAILYARISKANRAHVATFTKRMKKKVKGQSEAMTVDSIITMHRLRYGTKKAAHA